MKPKRGHVQEIASFKTTDGKLYTNLQEAKSHQQWVDFRQWCLDNICRGGEWDADMVVDAIWENFKVEPRED